MILNGNMKNKTIPRVYIKKKGSTYTKRKIYNLGPASVLMSFVMCLGNVQDKITNVLVLAGVLGRKKYFTSSDPHHDIYTFCY